MIELLEVGARFVTQLPRLGEVVVDMVVGSGGVVGGMDWVTGAGGLIALVDCVIWVVGIGGVWLPVLVPCVTQLAWITCIVLNLTRVGRQG